MSSLVVELKHFGIYLKKNAQKQLQFPRTLRHRVVNQLNANCRHLESRAFEETLQVVQIFDCRISRYGISV